MGREVTARVPESSPSGWAAALSSLPCAVPTRGRNSTDISGGPINSPKSGAWGRAVGAALQPRNAEAPQPRSGDAAPNTDPNPQPLGGVAAPPYVRVSAGLPPQGARSRVSSPPPGPAVRSCGTAPLGSPRPRRAVNPPAPPAVPYMDPDRGRGAAEPHGAAGKGLRALCFPKDFLAGPGDRRMGPATKPDLSH